MQTQLMRPAIEIASFPKVSVVRTRALSVNQPIKLAEYETRRWPYILSLPLMWLLTFYVMAKKAVWKLLGWPNPRINIWCFDGLGSTNRHIKEGAASWRALDIIYNYCFGTSTRKIVDDFWVGMMNAQAVRNRFKLVKQEVRQAILRFSNHQEVRLVSLACGSAQAVIETMAEFKAEGVIVRTILVDIDQSALDYASSLAERYGVLNQMEMRKASVSQIARVARDFQPQVIEMLGLLDYFPQDRAIRLVAKIRQSLQPNGVFLTCNIAPNWEMHFLHWVINWPMIYRTASELAEIVDQAGFRNWRIIYEPLRIHGLVIAQKE